MPNTLTGVLAKTDIDGNQFWRIVLDRVVFSSDSRKRMSSPEALMTESELQKLFINLILQFDFQEIDFKNMYNGAWIKRICVYQILRKLVEISPELKEMPELNVFIKNLAERVGATDSNSD